MRRGTMPRYSVLTSRAPPMPVLKQGTVVCVPEDVRHDLRVALVALRHGKVHPYVGPYVLQGAESELKLGDEVPLRRRAVYEITGPRDLDHRRPESRNLGERHTRSERGAPRSGTWRKGELSRDLDAALKLDEGSRWQELGAEHRRLERRRAAAETERLITGRQDDATKAAQDRAAR